MIESVDRQLQNVKAKRQKHSKFSADIGSPKANTKSSQASISESRLQYLREMRQLWEESS